MAVFLFTGLALNFVDNEIKIVDIKSGMDFNLALDINGKVYGWGNNDAGSCGIKIFILIARIVVA